jgi:STE24 endopeptidase
VITMVAAACLMAALAAVLVPWSWVPGGRLVAIPVGDLFSPAEVRRAESYAAVQRLLAWTSYGLSMVLLLVLGLTRAGGRLARRVAPRRWWWAVPTTALVVELLQLLVTMPFAAAAHHVDVQHGLSDQAWSGWALDQAKGLLVSWLATSLLLLVLVGCARRAPRWWFAWAGGAALVLSLAGSFLYPVVVEPLFNSFTPLPAGPLRTSVFALAAREGVHVDDVLVADASRRTTTLNAYVSGFGRTRRVVVYDTTLKALTPAETRVVIAHELGHAKNNDVAVGTAIGAVGAVAACALLALLLDADPLRRRSGTEGANDPAAVALVLALVAVGGFLVSPAQNTVSRAFEARADRESIIATGDGPTFVRMQRQLALRSLADPTPPMLSQLWWGTHPTVLQRAGLPSSMRAARR